MDTVGKEWFDRDYSARQVYGRLFRNARRYAWVLAIGVLSGMLVGGTWVPIFQMLQPALLQMQAGLPAKGAPAAKPAGVPAASSTPASLVPAGAPSPAEPALVDAAKMPRWFVRLVRDDKVSHFIRKTDGYTRKVGLRLIDEGGMVKVSFFVMVIFCVPLALLGRLLTVYINGYALQWAGLHVVRDIRNEMFSHLQDQSLVFFGRMDVGRLMIRCNNDPSTVQSVITSTISDMCEAPFEVLAAVGFVIYFAIQNDMLSMVLFALIGYPLAMGPLFWLGKKIRRYAKQGLERNAILGSAMLENLTGIRVVKAYNTEAAEKARFQAANQSVLKAYLRGQRVTLLVRPMMEVATILLAVIFLAVCFWKGKTLADIVPLLTPFVVAYKPLKLLGKVQSSLESGRAALTRIYSFLDLDTSLPVAAHPVRKAEFEQGITFDHVHFTYSHTNRQVIDDACFTLAHGRTVAVVGSTGSGKTTLANLLARFYDPTSGTVKMDGVDLRDLETGDLRKLIGVVTQETILFNSTIAENIAYGTPGVTPEQIVNAAKLANAHEFIMRNPEGYRRVVGDKGFVLSGGERQRIAIARAILKNPPILILDEATSALDTVTEQQVQGALSRLMANRTVFAIAHRLSTIRNADTILVLDQGRIIEQGSHAELYAKGGAYRALCDAQESAG